MATKKTATKKTASKRATTARCEACGDVHDTTNLRADRRAEENKVGHQLCPACHEFIAEVADREYVWCVTRMHREE